MDRRDLQDHLVFQDLEDRRVFVVDEDQWGTLVYLEKRDCVVWLVYQDYLVQWVNTVRKVLSVRKALPVRREIKETQVILVVMGPQDLRAPLVRRGRLVPLEFLGH